MDSLGAGGDQNAWRKEDRLKTGEEIAREREWERGWDMGVAPGV